MSRITKHLPFAVLTLAGLPWVFSNAMTIWGSTVADASQHMEYAWLIPVLSVLILWFRREPIHEAIEHPRPAPWTALGLLLVAIALLFVGVRGAQMRFTLLSFILVLMAVPCAAYGRALLRYIWFPIILLVFLTPVEFLDDMTGPMRRYSAMVTAGLLNGLGFDVSCRGTAIIGSGATPFQLDVEDPCSGIRSIVALFVGTAAYGAFYLKSITHRWLLFLSSFPIAFLGNIIRLFLTALVSILWGQKNGMVLHDNALFIVAPLYLCCVFWLAERFHKRELLKATSAPENKATEEVKILPPSRKPYVLWGILAVLLFGAWEMIRWTPSPTLEADTFITQTLQPLPGATMQRMWYCQSPECLASGRFGENEELPKMCLSPSHEGEHHIDIASRAERNILPKDTRIMRAAYQFSFDEVYVVSVIVAGQHRQSIHRPELCLPSQGNVFDSHYREILPGVPMICGELRSAGQAAATVGGFAYTYLNARGATVSDMKRVVGDTIQRALMNKISRWSMITISSPTTNFKTPQGEEKLRKFMEKLYPMVREDL